MTKNTDHTEEKQTKVQKAGTPINRVENDEDDQPSIGGAIFLGIFAAGSIWAYFNGYVIAIKRLSLGEYSFLIAGILFAALAIWQLVSYLKSKK
ncbi:MAG: hypothetical protein Q4B28_03950 [bacterium]|nr:hypothetical protein [bacterium]